jgi:FkbM family methyltransferase
MPFRMTSFASNFEDVLLDRAFGTQCAGFYIDVGAYDPVDHSVTHHFHEKGWRGINIEPNPAPFERLRDVRVRDVNLNIGLSNREGRLTVYEAPSACWSVDRGLITGWFGADQSQIVERSIPVKTLASVCDQHVPDGFVVDFLKIDVEGHEREVVEGADWSKWRPRVVLIEANQPEAWEPMLLGSGYLFALFDGVNRFYVRDEDRQLLSVLGVPVNVSDDFLIHGYVKHILALEDQLAQVNALGPVALGLARRIHQTALKHPKLASMLRPLFGRRAS